MDRRAPLALYHMLDAIEDLLTVLGSTTVAELSADRIRCHAAERCVEIISEASRRLPGRWKAAFPEIPWSDIAGIGNILRHNYDEVSLDIIVGLQGAPLDSLKRAVLALLDKYDPDGRPFRKR